MGTRDVQNGHLSHSNKWNLGTGKRCQLWTKHMCFYCYQNILAILIDISHFVADNSVIFVPPGTIEQNCLLSLATGVVFGVANTCLTAL